MIMKIIISKNSMIIIIMGTPNLVANAITAGVAFAVF
jgi:hypothetical protein